MPQQSLPPSAKLKLDLLFEGVRYSEALGEAAEHAFPNYYPYRFQSGEFDPTGTGKATIPYLMTTTDGTLVRLKGNGSSPWVVHGSRASGYRLRNTLEEGLEAISVSFEPKPRWMAEKTSDGFPMASAGVSLHGDMAVINVAPGCDYFTEKQDGVSMRCSFCAYGAPDARSAQLGQVGGKVSLPEQTYRRMQETLRAALAETDVRHIYLVGGSMIDWYQEGERYIELARAVQAINHNDIPVTCGSGALPDDLLSVLHDEGLVENVCFNLEIWSEPLFARVCPGKHRFVGYDRWVASLQHAVDLWGRGHVYSAMVAGIELEPEYEMSWESAANLAIEGAEDLCRRGIIPIYSLYWPSGGRDHPEYFSRLRAYFERLNLAYQDIRAQNDLEVWDGFMCRRCAYMQLECDIDHAARETIHA